MDGRCERPNVKAVEPQNELPRLVNEQPFRTSAAKPPKESDITNMMFLGGRKDLENAFQEAGWSTAEQLNAKSKLETFRAMTEQRGYKEAPVSILLLDGQPPDLVFQKQNDTFNSRHHLRIWRRPEQFHGKEVWVCSATHDTGIDFSEENRTFVHKVDGEIDRERAKVVERSSVHGAGEGAFAGGSAGGAAQLVQCDRGQDGDGREDGGGWFLAPGVHKSVNAARMSACVTRL